MRERVKGESEREGVRERERGSGREDRDLTETLLLLQNMLAETGKMIFYQNR